MCSPLVPQPSVKEAAVAVTGSLNVTATVESIGTPVAPSDGLVEETDGARSPAAVTTTRSMPTHSSFQGGVGRDHAHLEEGLVSGLESGKGGVDSA